MISTAPNSASEMTYIVSGGALNSTHSLLLRQFEIEKGKPHEHRILKHNRNRLITKLNWCVDTAS